MKCSRCATEIPDSATICPRCGNEMHKSRSASFSYLPAGAPSWPTSTPEHIPNVVQSYPVNEPAMPVAPINYAPPTRRKSKAGGVVGIIAVIILAPVLGMLITYAFVSGHTQPAQTIQQTNNSNTTTTGGNNTGGNNGTAPSATPTPDTKPQDLPTPTSFKTTQDSTINVSLKYPSDWTALSPQSSSSATSMNIISQQQFEIDFFIAHLTDSASANYTSASQINQSAIASLSQYQISNIQNVTASNAQPTIGGQKWAAQDATFVDGTQTPQHFESIAVQRGNSYYVINIFAPDSLYSTAMQKDINPILSSIHFLS